jgi:signal transduction histidine kinase
VGVVGTQEDVTERKLAMEELKAAKAAAETANRAKDAFLANMSHELRTPLNGVLGMTDLLMESGLTRDQLEMAEVVRTAGLSLLRVVSDLLDFSRLEAGQISPRSVPFHLQEMVDQVVAVVRPEAKRKGLQLFVSPIPKLPYALRGDPGRIKQVLMQYLGNAVKFTDAGTISLQVQVLEKARQVDVVLSVRDKGPGIEPQLMNKLFQPFSQVDDSSTRRHGGVGMGLAICKSLADMMGGSVGAESTPGSGSTFWLRLSLATCAENPPLSLPF